MPRRRPPSSRRRLSILVAAIVAALLAGGCSGLASGTPVATPTDFAGIVAELANSGIGVARATSGDPGCADQRLARTAIAFDAVGAGIATPTRLYLYSFRDPTVFDELRPSVDACARSYVTDPASFGTVDVAPYVIAGPGPWPASFRDALRAALQRAAAGG